MSKDSSDKPAVKPAANSVPWNPWLGFLFGILVFIAAQITAGILISLYPVIRGWTSAQAVNWLQHALVAQLTYLALSVTLTVGGVLLFVRNYGKPGLRSIGVKKPHLKDPLYGLLAFPVYYVILIAAVMLAKVAVPSLDVNQAQDLGLNARYTGLQLVFIFICLAGLAPLAEELLFRGLVYSSLKKATSLWAAVLVTSALFAAGHLSEGGSSGPLYIGAIDTFVLSLVE
jgi:membrane protease YdiL (CAAX protease family)